MTLEELTKLIKSRRSIRKWQEKEVPEALLLQAVELATWAPNGGGAQNWHFYIIKNKAIINAIADAQQTFTNSMASWPEAAKFAEQMAGAKQRAALFRNAPAAIVIAAGRYMMPQDQVIIARAKTDPEAAKVQEWRNMSSSRVQTVGAAAMTLLLTLHQAGLGAVYMTGPMQIKGTIEKLLNTPPELDVMAFIPVGYAAESPEPKPRKPMSEVCQVIK